MKQELCEEESLKNDEETTSKQGEKDDNSQTNSNINQEKDNYALKELFNKDSKLKIEQDFKKQQQNKFIYNEEDFPDLVENVEKTKISKNTNKAPITTTIAKPSLSKELFIPEINADLELGIGLGSQDSSTNNKPSNTKFKKGKKKKFQDLDSEIFKKIETNLFEEPEDVTKTDDILILDSNNGNIKSSSSKTTIPTKASILNKGNPNAPKPKSNKGFTKK